MQHGKVEIDPDVFFRDFLAVDPKYGAVALVLDSLQRELKGLLGMESMSLSQFIDLTSIEYDESGEVIPKDERFLKALAKAMQLVDITRTVLKTVASSGLTPDQIAQGPTSIKVPVSMLCEETSFRRFTRGLSGGYQACSDFSSLISAVHAARVHQKPVFLLYENEGVIGAYYSPSWSMQEMRERVLCSGDSVALDIYNSKAPLNTFCNLVRETPGGHVKALYLGKKKN